MLGAVDPLRKNSVAIRTLQVVEGKIARSRIILTSVLAFCPARPSERPYVSPGHFEAAYTHPVNRFATSET